MCNLENIASSTPHSVVLSMTRISASKKSMRLAPIYRAAFPDDLRIDMCIAVAMDVAMGVSGDDDRRAAEVIASAAHDDANRCAETCAINQVARYWAAADAAEAVLEALQPVVDINAVCNLENSSRARFSMSRYSS